MKIQTLTSFNSEIFPSAKFLGTNCFILGSGPKRILVDTGSFPEVDRTFGKRLLKMMLAQKFRIEKIYLT